MSTLAPPAAVELLDSWLTLMLNAVAGQGGVVSRADGDTLLALFGEQDLPAGDTALHAARAALEMHELVRQFNAERARAGEPALTMGVGIATGAVLTSSASAFERAGVACVGAAVERAATLQWAAEANGLEVVLDGESAAALNGRMHAPRLAGITLAPRKLPASMHTLAPVPP
jgi:class 3 adenylate cyclase